MKYSVTTAGGVLLAICMLAALKGALCCELSWSRYDEHCYRIYSFPVSALFARWRCLLEGSNLVSIPTTSVLDFIAQHTAHSDQSKFWVGLIRRGHDYAWLDGNRPVSVSNLSWVETLPYDNELPVTGCFIYDGALVKHADCDEIHPFICSHSISKKKQHNCRLDVNLEHSFVGEITGNCLFRTIERTTKDNAANLCNRYRGQFVNIENMMKDGLTAFYDHKVLSNDGSKYWTDFVWNGTDMLRRSGQVLPMQNAIPVVKGSGSCITVQFNFTDVLLIQFYQTDCDDRAYAVCSQSEDEDTTGTRTTRSYIWHRDDDDDLLKDEPSLSCPEGYNWKSDRTNNYCYWETSFETDQLSWDDAERYCQSYGGHLGSFHSKEEEQIGLSFQYGSLSHPYWIGLSLDPETETYKWNDGSTLDYLNWAPGHPDHKDKKLRCVAMEAQESHWVSSLCGILSWFICKVPKKTSHPPPIIPTPTPLESCGHSPVVIPGKSSYYFQGACYFAVNEAYSWHRAKQYCENEGASLVSIHTSEEIGFLLRLLHDSVMETNRVWIGLNSFGSDGSFLWTDWTVVDFTFFSENEPNNYQNQEKCCNMYTRNGQWNDENCNAALGFVCKRLNSTTVSTEIPVTRDPRIGNCKRGWIAHYDRCYYLGGKREKDRVNWTEALDICQKHEGYMASIRDEKDQRFLSFLLQTLEVDAWIGLHDTIQSGRYYWLDNSDVQYTNWAPGEPSFFGIMQDCVKMVYDHLNSGVWKDEECDHRMGYICQSNKDPKLPPSPSERGGVNCVHPQGWLKLEKMCFKMFEGSPLTWKQAEKVCQSEGGHLASVSDQRIKAVVSHLAAEVNQPFFIGLKYDKNSQQVRWVNGFPVMLSNWEKNEPSLLTGDTCFASTSEGYWKKYLCDEKMPFVCQITTSKPATLKRYTGECPESSRYWTPGSGSFCYILSKDIRSDWFTANMMCFRYGSHLASIHSMEDIEFLKTFMESEVKSVFLGLMRNKKGGFTWTDDTPVDFVNWDEDEPSNSEDQCVEMMASTMKWRVVACIGKKHFICQDRKVTLVIEDPQAEKFVDEPSGISTASICAVVFSILIGVVLIVAAALYRRRSSRGTQFQRGVRGHSISFENALYNVGSASLEFNDENKSQS